MEKRKREMKEQMLHRRFPAIMRHYKCEFRDACLSMCISVYRLLEIRTLISFSITRDVFRIIDHLEPVTCSSIKIRKYYFIGIYDYFNEQ